MTTSKSQTLNVVLSSTLLFLILMFPSRSFSQSEFRKGFVVKSEGDTLFGLVDYRESARAYEVCSFKRVKRSEKVQFSPDTAVAYGIVDDRFFQSRRLKWEGMEDTVFIEVLVNGIVSLYKYKEIFLVESSDKHLLPLRSEMKESIYKGKRVLRKSNQYLGILTTKLYDCEEIRPDLKNVSLTQKSLTTLIERYNRCKGIEPKVYKVKKPWFKAMIGVTMGTNVSAVNFTARDPLYAPLTGQFEKSVSPVGGISLDLLSPRLSERISFTGNLLYLNDKLYRYSSVQNGASFERNYVEIAMEQLKIPVGFRYTFPKRIITPYFNVGVSETIHLNKSARWTTEIETQNVVRTYGYELAEVKKHQFGIWGGIGIVKSLSAKIAATVEMRYEHTDGIVRYVGDNATPTSKLTNFQIVVGIKTR